jgi:hypothetical protein
VRNSSDGFSSLSSRWPTCASAKAARAWAYLQGLDPAYGPFATRLDALAQGYHSKQLAAFVARFRTENAVPPA